MGRGDFFHVRPWDMMVLFFLPAAAWRKRRSKRPPPPLPPRCGGRRSKPGMGPSVKNYRCNHEYGYEIPIRTFLSTKSRNPKRREQTPVEMTPNM